MLAGWRFSGTLAVAGVLSSLAVHGEDWSRFRGPNGSGVSTESASIPTEWSDSKNLKWKADLPGPGSSCPIVVGDRTFLTCWSGYGDGGEGGSLEQLKRHLICIDRRTGKQQWSQAVDAVLPEDQYRGMFAEHGYASHTPVSDGESVFAFFGKSGVYAYSVAGKPLWNANVGTDLGESNWGSSSSPILYKNLLIVTAAAEDHAIVALDKATGKEVWKQEADGFGSTWGTPILVDTGERTELVIGVPYEIWAINPDTGKLLWYCEAISSNSTCSSVIAHDGVIYLMESGPGGGGAIAVKPGGKGDVTKTHVLWSNRERSRISTPVIDDGRLYFISSGVANCIDCKTGERIYQARLNSGSSAPASEEPNRGNPGNSGRGGRFGGGGRGGGQDYSSPVIADGKLFYARRSGETYVVKLGPKFEQLAVNKFQSAEGDFSATPAVSQGDLFLRSSRTLYCVGKSE